MFCSGLLMKPMKLGKLWLPPRGSARCPSRGSLGKHPKGASIDAPDGGRMGAGVCASTDACWQTPWELAKVKTTRLHAHFICGLPATNRTRPRIIGGRHALIENHPVSPSAPFLHQDQQNREQSLARMDGGTEISARRYPAND